LEQKSRETDRNKTPDTNPPPPPPTRGEEGAGRHAGEKTRISRILISQEYAYLVQNYTRIRLFGAKRIHGIREFLEDFHSICGKLMEFLHSEYWINSGSENTLPENLKV